MFEQSWHESEWSHSYGVLPKDFYAKSTVTLCCHKCIVGLIQYYIVYVSTTTLLYKVIQGHMFRL